MTNSFRLPLLTFLLAISAGMWFASASRTHPSQCDASCANSALSVRL